MKLEDIVKELNLTILSSGASMDADVTNGCCCDLLSWVMAKGKRGDIWITVQTHVNTVAVASLLELACIILPAGVTAEDKTIEKAKEEGIAVLSTDMDAFELCGKLYRLGIGNR